MRETTKNSQSETPEKPAEATPVKQTFYVPALGINVEAESHEEAEKIAKELKAKEGKK